MLRHVPAASRVVLHDEKTSGRKIRRREKKILPRNLAGEERSDSGGSFLLFNLINEVVGLAEGSMLALTQCNGGDILFRVNLMPEIRSSASQVTDVYRHAVN